MRYDDVTFEVAAKMLDVSIGTLDSWTRNRNLFDLKRRKHPGDKRFFLPVESVRCLVEMREAYAKHLVKNADYSDCDPASFKALVTSGLKEAGVSLLDWSVFASDTPIDRLNWDDFMEWMDE